MRKYNENAEAGFEINTLFAFMAFSTIVSASVTSLHSEIDTKMSGCISVKGTVKVLFVFGQEKEEMLDSAKRSNYVCVRVCVCVSVCV